MSKLIKRKDGSYSKRGLWDNIRANKGSGKKPTKQMLKQESKIKKEEDMKSMYKKGGKASKPMKKESFMEESKELHFGAPGVKPPMKKYGMGGKEGDPLKATADSTAYYNNKVLENFTKAKKSSGAGNNEDYMNFISMAKKASADRDRQENKGKPGFDKNGYPIKKYEMAGFLKKTLPSDDSDPRNSARVRSGINGAPKKLVEKTYETVKDEEGYPTGFSNKTKKVTKFPLMYNAEGQKEVSPVVVKEKTKKVSDTSNAGGKGTNLSFSGPGQMRTGGKSMEPGGGGRFAALVSKLKSKGKSEDQAKGIAAAAGRAKYGKSKFQAMAAAGRKKG